MREKIPKTESPSKRQFKDNETAEDVREKAMVRLKRPRNAIQTKEELLQNVIESLVDFLREKTAADREIKEIEVTCKTTGTGKSTANDESYVDSAATTE